MLLHKSRRARQEHTAVDQDEVSGLVGRSVALAVVLWHRRLGMGMMRMAVRGLRATATCFSGPGGFRWGTACSGTDILLRVVEHLSEYWEQSFGVKVSFGSLQMVPFSDGFAMGFSCTSRSPASRNAGRNVNCIQRRDLDAATSATFWAGLDYIRKAKPALVMLGNVKELEQKTHSGDQGSDAEAVLKEIRDSGYEADLLLVDASEYGSCPRRPRLYFFAFEGKGAMGRAKCRFVKRMLDCMKIGLGKPSDVLMEGDSEIFGQVREAFMSRKKQKVDADTTKVQFKSDHMEIVASAGLEWPPSFQEDAQGFDASGMGQRMKEAAWFIHKVFPPQLERRGQL